MALITIPNQSLSTTLTPDEFNEILEATKDGTLEINTAGIRIAGTAITASAAELNILDGITATTAELNILDGATLTVTELNYVDGVTSAIQTQLDAKAPLVSPSFTTPTLGVASATSLDVNNGNITEIKQAVYNGVVDDGNSSTADTIDWSTGSIHKSTLTGNCEYTFTAPTGVSRLSLQVVQGAGPYTVTWPASVKWAGATAPTLGTTSGRSDWITFIWDGTNYWGVASTNFN